MRNMPPPRPRVRDYPATLAMAAIVLVVLASLVGLLLNALHVETMTCTVTDKDRTSVSDGQGNSSSDARVYTEQCGTLRVADSWLSLTFSSADTYASIEAGNTYVVKTRGYRVPFLSMFPNVVEAVEVP